MKQGSQDRQKPANNPGQEENSNDQAETLCATGLYCAETVLSVIARDHNIHSPLIPRIATGLCSGMARTCGTCGALTGGILAINIVHGRSTPDESVEPNYALVESLIKRFTTEFETTNCAQLLNCDLATKEGQQKFKSQNLAAQCEQYTRQSVSIVRDLLAGNSPSDFSLQTPEQSGE